LSWFSIVSFAPSKVVSGAQSQPRPSARTAAVAICSRIIALAAKPLDSPRNSFDASLTPH